MKKKLPSIDRRYTIIKACLLTTRRKCARGEHVKSKMFSLMFLKNKTINLSFPHKIWGYIS